MAQEFVYTMNDLRKVIGDRTILDGITLSFLPGAKIGVLGANGAGKSTLLRIMAGVDEDVLGEAKPAKGLRVGYLPQEPELDESKDVLGNVEEGVAEIRALLDEFNELSMKFGEEMSDDEMNALLEKQGKLQDQIDAADAWEIDRTLDVAMEALRCPAGDADVAKLSGGEKRRVALTRLLLSKPDMLLLDEPTNHLDAESVAWLERFLQEYPGTVVAITHDRYFLDNVAGWILELDRGRGIPWQGNYSSWLEQKNKRLEVEEKQAGARARTLSRELEWIKMSPRARQAKGKARINAYEELVKQGGERSPEKVEIAIPVPERLGDVVVDADGLRKAFGDKLLIDDLHFKLPPGGIVGIIGANGAGKTTLFKMVAGEETPDTGTIRLGETVSPVVRRPGAAGARGGQDGLGGDLGGRREDPDREPRSAVARVGLVVQLQGAGSAEAGRIAVGRRAQSRQPRAPAADGRQRAAARRAPRTTSTSTRCGPSKTRSSTSRAARS